MFATLIAVLVTLSNLLVAVGTPCPDIDSQGCYWAGSSATDGTGTPFIAYTDGTGEQVTLYLD